MPPEYANTFRTVQRATVSFIVHHLQDIWKVLTTMICPELVAAYRLDQVLEPSQIFNKQK